MNSMFDQIVYFIKVRNVWNRRWTLVPLLFGICRRGFLFHFLKFYLAVHTCTHKEREGGGRGERERGSKREMNEQMCLFLCYFSRNCHSHTGS